MIGLGPLALSGAQEFLAGLQAGREERSAAEFAREVLGHDPWSIPEQIMAALTKPRAMVAVKACHSSSKTFTAAEIALWWVKDVGGIVITTAPTDEQVKRLLWGEIKNAHRNALEPIGGYLLEKELRFSEFNYALGLSTNESVRFQGFHGAKVLFILDEAMGVRPDIWLAIDGARAGGDVRVLAIGNPTVPTGPFYAAFNKDRRRWTTFTIDAFDTPNLIGITEEELASIEDEDDPRLAVVERDYLTLRRWVWEMLKTYGPNHPEYEARVRGRFPTMAEDQLLSAEWFEEAARRRLPFRPTDPWEAGVDVAGPGDDETVVTIRRGATILAQQAFTAVDPRGPVLAYLRPWDEHAQRSGKRLLAKVDEIGIGYLLAGHLRDHGLKAVGINVANKSRDSERYRDAKAEHYWGLRLRMQEGDFAIAGGIDLAELISQATAIKWKPNARGQIEIESKEALKKRGVSSPDRIESVMLAYCRPGVVTPGSRRVGTQTGRTKLKTRT